MKKGLFIALEGGEGTGKTTISKAICEKLVEKGIDVIVTREPGGIASAEAIRNTIMDFEVDPKTELLLYLSARREHLVQKIKPVLERGGVVISDRFYLSSLVYQGYARGLGMETVRELNNFVCDIFPDVNIIIDVPAEIGVKRKFDMAELNRFDLEGADFHKKVEEGYKILIDPINKEVTDNICVVDGTKSLEEVTDAVFKIVLENL
ncbi:MAG: dTMP kinase [Epulopiscium sp. Nele67-Bin005]|nr:MAG: dTMP kinase [Epulopiscium sp. Nele67-Bin005]